MIIGAYMSESEPPNPQSDPQSPQIEQDVEVCIKEKRRCDAVFRYSGGGTRLEPKRGESERARHGRAKSVTYDHIQRPRAPTGLAVYLDSGGGTRTPDTRIMIPLL